MEMTPEEAVLLTRALIARRGAPMKYVRVRRTVWRDLIARLPHYEFSNRFPYHGYSYYEAVMDFSRRVSAYPQIVDGFAHIRSNFIVRVFKAVEDYENADT